MAGTRGKVRLEALPGYAPDLNPWDEGGWHHLKHVEMRNLVCLDLEELHQEFHLAVGRAPTEASFGPILLCASRIEALKT